MKKIFTTLIITMLLIVVPTTIQSTSMQSDKQEQSQEIGWWPMFHHDLANSGYTTSAAPETNNILWKYKREGKGSAASPIIVDYKAYIGSDDGALYCLNYSDGSFIWKYKTGDTIDCAPSFYNEKIYFSSRDDKLYCLNADTGVKIWDFTGIDDIHKSPAVVNGKVFIAVSHDKVYCLDADTGVIIWEALNGSGNSPAIVNEKLYTGIGFLNDDGTSYNGTMYCLNINDGSIIWNYQVGHLICSSPAYANGKIYFGADTYKMYCLDADTGDEIWTYKANLWIDSSPAVANGKVFFGSIDENIYCLDAETGEKIWNYYISSIVASSPAVAEDKVYIGSKNRYFYCFDVDTGDIIWEYQTDGSIDSSPAIADGKVYIGSDDGYVYCFDGEQQDPKIDIEIKKELLHGIIINIQNIGNNQLEDVTVKTTVKKLGIFNKILLEEEDYLESIDVDSTETFTKKPFGFGPIEITIDASIPNLDSVVETVRGFVFFRFLLLI